MKDTILLILLISILTVGCLLMAIEGMIRSDRFEERHVIITEVENES